MHTLQAIITGSIQGLSEFLPISSSAHIVFSNELYGLITNTDISNTLNEEEVFFDIMVHLATLFAVLIYFFNDLKTIILDFFKSIKTKEYKNENFKLVNYIALSTIITGVIGLVLKEKVENLITNPQIVCILLFITGIILLFSERMYKGNKKITLKSAILISIAQGLAVFPGFSRSGLTIATGLFQGLDRVQAARFSFLMSIPIILLASLVYPIIELDFSQIMTFNFKAIICGFIASFVVGYFCIKYFMRLLGKLSLRSFAYYCFVASIVMFLLFQFFYHQQ
ncbi:MAG: undecaprenyl-diphosphate phosphatase [Candidatus Gastranaerophilales bacterium]|nr:undecaprenyl-diphosphate phosphatase [Candidatus Gastranaerophilales bacterium]